MADKITLADEFGNEYTFSIYPILTRFKALAGIYCFAGERDGAWSIYYIGETSSFERRIDDQLLAHHRYQCAIKRGATHFFVMVLADDEARLALEASLRRNYDPPCNQQ